MTGLLAQDPSRLARARERSVDATERLDPDEIAQDEHVQRDLQAQLRLDLRGRMRCLPGLVVLDDPARAERVDVDAVDLSRECDARSDREPTLKLGRRALRSEPDLEASRNERRLGGRVLAHERLEVAPQSVLQLAPLQRCQLHPNARHRVLEAPAQERHGRLDALLVHAIDTELLRKAGVETEQRLMRDRTSEARIDLGVDRARVDHALEQPHRGTVREPLQLRNAERGAPLQLLEDEWVRQSRAPLEGAQRALEPPLPTVRRRDAVGEPAVP